MALLGLFCGRKIRSHAVTTHRCRVRCTNGSCWTWGWCRRGTLPPCGTSDRSTWPRLTTGPLVAVTEIKTLRFGTGVTRGRHWGYKGSAPGLQGVGTGVTWGLYPCQSRLGFQICQINTFILNKFVTHDLLWQGCGKCVPFHWKKILV